MGASQVSLKYHVLLAGRHVLAMLPVVLETTVGFFWFFCPSSANSTLLGGNDSATVRHRLRATFQQTATQTKCGLSWHPPKFHLGTRNASDLDAVFSGQCRGGLFVVISPCMNRVIGGDQVPPARTGWASDPVPCNVGVL